MDVDLIALALLLAAAGSAHALGPGAPFTPPHAASAALAEATAPSSELINGLAGVRLGATPQALIDGQWHRSGAAVRGAVLQAITREGITLRHADGRAEHLWLLPRPTNHERAKP